MNILVVNDDGIKEKGIHILAKALKKYGDVIVCAPQSGRSASSHSIIISSPLKFEKVNAIEDVECYQTDGMPADCVRLANTILQCKIDLVVSGINNGLNVGTDIIYSGTVAAAREAFIQSIPSIAISTDVSGFDIVDKELSNVLDLIFQKKLYSKEYILNVNFPSNRFKESKGIKIAKQGIKRFKTYFANDNDSIYIPYKEDITYDDNANTDVYLCESGYITLVPLVVEQTYYKAIEELRNRL